MHFYRSQNGQTDLIDARARHPKLTGRRLTAACLKEGYLPSVTTILSVIKEEQIEVYRRRKALEHYAAHGDLEAAVHHEDDAHSATGTLYHAELERLLNSNLQMPLAGVDAAVREHVAPLYAELRQRAQAVLLVEHRFADEALRYGGTIDAVLLRKDRKLLVLDYKTKKFDGGSAPFENLAYAAQLSAYRRYVEKALGQTGVLTANAFLNSALGQLKTPHAVLRHYRGDQYPLFERALELWYAVQTTPLDSHDQKLLYAPGLVR
jgi:ATP-dependent exoDNAse (exonuclease V) beta subunit